jgi:hypothetical protein
MSAFTAGLAPDVRRAFSDVLRRIVGSEAVTAAVQAAYTPTPWVAPSLGNSWVNYGGIYQTCAYRKIGDIVYLRGLVRNGTIGAAMFYLPVGFRVTAHTHMSAGDVNSTGGIVQTTTDGAVFASTPSGNGWVSLDGLQFSVTAVGYDPFPTPPIVPATSDVYTTPWTDVVYENSWTNYDTVYHGAQYRKVGDRVELRGLVRSGTVGNTIFTMPVGFRPQRPALGMTITKNTVGSVSAVRISYSPTGSVAISSVEYTGANPAGVAWTSLEHCSFSTAT